MMDDKNINLSKNDNGKTFVGVDIGGTFTDVVLRKSDGTVVMKKISSTGEDPSTGVLEGLMEICNEENVDPSTIESFIHGTTVATNTILEHKGAKTGLLTTKGFRDVLEIARIRMPTLFDLTWDKPEPLIRRQFRLEVDERIDARGNVLEELDEDSVIEAIDRMAAHDIESVAICLLNSYANPIHEKKVEKIVKERYPNLYVTCSYQVLPEIKEYERTSTTAVNSYILPKVQDYINALSDGLKSQNIDAPLLIVGSNGGVVSAKSASDYPAKIVASGPAAGVTGSAKLLESIGLDDAITFDMGGTTAKASIIEDNEPVLANEYEVRAGISTPSRFIKAGGYLLKVPAIDIGEVGNGGGSIAWIDKGGSLQVGPHSAGSVPGPVCYDNGGTEPTVTDANLILGYLNPTALGGGNLKLDYQITYDTMKEKIADPLGISVEEAAYGIRQVANANMIRAVRAVTIERGRDPRNFSMIGFGGNGGVHGPDVAESLNISKVIIPQLPGVFSAVGLLACDVQHEFVSSNIGLLEDMDATISKVIQELEEEGREKLHAEGYTEEYMELEFSFDLRYQGQSSEINVSMAESDTDTLNIDKISTRFREEYKTTFGYETGEQIELVNIRLTAKGHRVDAPDLANLQVIHDRVVDEPYERQAYFGEEFGYLPTKVIDRNDLTREVMNGPVIVESYDSTVIVRPTASVQLDEWGNISVQFETVKPESEEKELITSEGDNNAGK